MDKGFAACPRVRARKTRKNYKKTGLESARLWVTQQQGFYTLPPASPVGERRLRRRGHMPKLGPLSLLLSRLLRWASLACSCCHSATLGEAMTAFTVRAT